MIRPLGYLNAAWIFIFLTLICTALEKLLLVYNISKSEII